MSVWEMREAAFDVIEAAYDISKTQDEFQPYELAERLDGMDRSTILICLEKMELDGILVSRSADAKSRLDLKLYSFV
ncbi:MAG: hypothetical protein OXC95_04975 [Dehalococcoidia bacterium]|nr:hypothetical protein [Dehalococcoidia bacterium]